MLLLYLLVTLLPSLFARNYNYYFTLLLAPRFTSVSNSVLYTGEMKAEFVRILSHVQSFFSGFPRDLYH